MSSPGQPLVQPSSEAISVLPGYAELRYAALPELVGTSLSALFSLDPLMAEVLVGREGLSGLDFRILLIVLVLCLALPLRAYLA